MASLARQIDKKNCDDLKTQFFMVVPTEGGTYKDALVRLPGDIFVWGKNLKKDERTSMWKGEFVILVIKGEIKIDETIVATNVESRVKSFTAGMVAVWKSPKNRARTSINFTGVQDSTFVIFSFPEDPDRLGEDVFASAHQFEKTFIQDSAFVYHHMDCSVSITRNDFKDILPDPLKDGCVEVQVDVNAKEGIQFYGDGPVYGKMPAGVITVRARKNLQLFALERLPAGVLQFIIPLKK
jgi:hypothetical protein